MGDNLSLIEQQVDNDIDSAGAPGSILAVNHNAILKSVLNNTGKYVGSSFIAKKNEVIVPTGIFSWNGNAMNSTNQFTITVSKLTADLNDFSSVLDTITTGSVLRFKDYVGRSVFLDYVSHVADQDGNSNDIYNIEVVGHASNPNYIYQNTEQQICVIEILIKALTGIDLGYEIITKMSEMDVLINNSTPGVWLFTNSIVLDTNKIIPLNVTLEFRNATIDLNGFTLTGADTKITDTERQIFIGSTMAGTWDVEIATPVWFGAVGDGVIDNSTAFQTALDTFRNIRIPSGDWIVDNLNLESGMSIVGDNYKTSILHSKIASTNPIFKISAEPVNNIFLSNFFVQGLETIGQDCFYFEAQPLAVSPFHGGLWMSVIERIKIRGFRGRSLFLKGHHTNYLEPNQFLSFRNLDIKRTDHSESICLLIIGQAGQITFDNCILDGDSAGSVGYNIVLSRVYLNGAVLGGVTEGGILQGNNAPSNISFVNNCTTQSSVNGIRTESATNINLKSTWFENLHYAIEIDDSSVNVIVEKCRFANAGDDGVGTGYCISNGSGCVLVAKENYIIGNADKWIKNTGHTREDNNYLGSTSLISSGVVKNVGLSTNTLNAKSNKNLLVNTSANSLTTVTSNIGTGEKISIVVHGSGNYLKVTSAGNIKTPVAGSLIFRHRDTFSLLRDEGDNYFITDISIKKLEALTIPNSGYYEKGEFVYNTNPSVDENDMILYGWSRLVTGTAHILEADWVEFYGYKNSTEKLLKAKSTLSSAQILALNTTPIEVVSAQGVGTAVLVHQVSYRYNFVTTAYSAQSSMQVTYTGHTEVVHSVSNILDQIADLIKGGFQVSVSELYENIGISVETPVGDPTLGDGTVDVYVTYEILTL